MFGGGFGQALLRCGGVCMCFEVGEVFGIDIVV